MSYSPSIDARFGTIKGLNLVPTAAQITAGESSASGSSWAQFWSDFVWAGPSGFQGQIDLAHALGCNAVRCIVNGGSGLWSGMFTANQHAQRINQVIAYCRSLGMTFYPAIGGQNEYQGYQSAPGGNGTVSGFGAITAWAATVAASIASQPNILGIDLCQEAFLVTESGMEKAGATNLTDNQCSALIAQLQTAVRLAAPTLPLTVSWVLLDYRLALSNAVSDYTDLHVYTGNVTPSAVPAYVAGVTQCQNKQLMIGEYGYNDSGGSGTSAWIDTVQSSVIKASYTNGIKPFGGLVWASIPQLGSDYGLSDGSGDIRPAGTHYQATVFGSPWPEFPRRRRRAS